MTEEGFDATLTMVWRLAKMAHFISTVETAPEGDVAHRLGRSISFACGAEGNRERQGDAHYG